jgi:hypothetical protein
MAQADGTILINTEIKKDGAIDDITSLKQVVRELTTALRDMTTTLTNAFNGTSQSSSATKQFDDISKSAKEAEADVKSLEEQMSKITVDRGEQNNTSSEWKRESHPSGEFINYGNSVQDFVNKYAAGMDTVNSKNVEVKQSVKQATAEIESDFKEAEQSPSMLGNTIGLLKNTVSSLVGSVRSVGIGMLESFASGGSQVMNVGQKVDALKGKIDALEKQGLYFGDKEYDQAYASLKKAETELEQYKKRLTQVSGEQKKATKSNKAMNKGLKDTKRNADGAKMSLLGMLGRSILFSTVFRGISVISNGLKEGTENIARYSKTTNAALSSLMSSLTMLKNSIAAAFAPILTVAAPALSKLISLLAEANNWIGQTMAALAGKDTFVKAVAVQEDYAASLSETQKAIKDAAKEAKKATFAFDTLIQAQKPEDEKYKGPTPDQMFNTEQVSTEAKTLADNIKKTLSDLFQPIKESWDQYGPSTISAVQTMFGSLKRLASDIGASFMKVWKDEGYGKAITDDLLITFTNFSLTIANLADQFDKAWTEAETGTSIMRHLGDLVLVVTGFFREASESIKNWAASLDFGPLLRAFDGLLVSLLPIVQKVGAVLLWLLNNVLLPLTKWALEKAIPAIFDLISAALTVLDSVIEALKPLAIWLWEDFIKPFGEWTGETIIGALKGLTDKLESFSNWIKDNKSEVQAITILIVSFFAAWKIATFITGIIAMIAKIQVLSQILGLLGIDLVSIIQKLVTGALKFGALTLAIAGIISMITILALNWGKMSPSERVISSILAAASAVGILAVSIGALQGAWGAAAMAAALAAGIIAARIAINAGSRTVASGSQSELGGGSRSFAATNSYAAYSNNVPHLATGTVVPPKAGNFLAMLGDNNKDYEVVSPLGTIRQAVDEALDARGGLGGGGSITVIMEVDGTKFGQAVYKYNNKESQRVGARMVTGG